MRDKKLTRGKGTGDVTFGSEVEQQQAEQVQEQMELQIGDLLTPNERFTRIEKAIERIAAKLEPGDQSAVMRELKGE